MSIQEADPITFNVEYFEGVKRVLEIGVGSNGMSAITPVLDPELYVVTDMPKKDKDDPWGADFAKHSLMLWRKSDERIVRMYADATRLPFQDKAFDAVFAANVIGDPFIPTSDKFEMIAEALRVVNSTSSSIGASALWLVEWNTPKVATSVMRQWAQSETSKGLVVEKATVPARHDALRGPFGIFEYPISAGHGVGTSDIYKIRKLEH